MFLSTSPLWHGKRKEIFVKKTPIYQSASGPVAIRMTNDYLFKALMQKNLKVCKALTCSLLHLDPETVESAEV
jgi:hypothetical protein